MGCFYSIFSVEDRQLIAILDECNATNRKNFLLMKEAMNFKKRHILTEFGERNLTVTSSIELHNIFNGSYFTSIWHIVKIFGLITWTSINFLLIPIGTSDKLGSRFTSRHALAKGLGLTALGLQQKAFRSKYHFSLSRRRHKLSNRAKCEVLAQAFGELANGYALVRNHHLKRLCP